MTIAGQLSLSLSILLFLLVNIVFAQAVNATQIARLINQGEIEKARQSLEAQNPTTADRLFFEGQILKAQGQLRQAIAIFRQLLQQAPDYRNARRELAHSLFLAGHYDLAEQQFFNLLQNEPNQAVAQGYRRFLGFIGAGKPTGWASDFAVLPSSNVNRGTTNTVFNTILGRYEIDPQSQAESGTGVRLGLSGYINFPTGVGQRLVLRAHLRGAFYQEQRFNSTIGQIGLAYRQRQHALVWSLGPYYRHQARGDEADNHAAGLNLAIARDVGVKNTLRLQLAHERRQFPHQNYQNGGFQLFGLSLRHQLTDRLSLGFGGRLSRSDPQAAHLQYDGQAVFAQVSQTVGGRWHMGGHMGVGRRQYRGVFPLTTAPRQDRFSRFSASLRDSALKWQGFTPQLSCSHTINHSNVAFYNFTTSECTLQIAKLF